MLGARETQVVRHVHMRPVPVQLHEVPRVPLGIVPARGARRRAAHDEAGHLQAIHEVLEGVREAAAHRLAPHERADGGVFERVARVAVHRVQDERVVCRLHALPGRGKLGEGIDERARALLHLGEQARGLVAVDAVARLKFPDAPRPRDALQAVAVEPEHLGGAAAHGLVGVVDLRLRHAEELDARAIGEHPVADGLVRAARRCA